MAIIDKTEIHQKEIVLSFFILLQDHLLLIATFVLELKGAYIHHSMRCLHANGTWVFLN